jgi:hypothetical protein
VDSRPAPEGTEYPLSEGGVWSHHGFHYAYLTGLALDHQGEAVVHVSPTLAGEPHEAEILLGWADSVVSAREATSASSTSKAASTSSAGTAPSGTS